MKNELRLVYITTQNKLEARAIGRGLVREKLAACVNILDGMESIYSWEGKIAEDQECVLIAKTTATLVNKLTDFVCEHHGYDCPCVISLSVSENEGNAEYLEWLINETKDG